MYSYVHARLLLHTKFLLNCCCANAFTPILFACSFTVEITSSNLFNCYFSTARWTGATYSSFCRKVDYRKPNLRTDTFSYRNFSSKNKNPVFFCPEARELRKNETSQEQGDILHKAHTPMPTQKAAFLPVTIMNGDEWWCMVWWKICQGATVSQTQQVLVCGTKIQPKSQVFQTKNT